MSDNLVEYPSIGSPFAIDLHDSHDERLAQVEAVVNDLRQKGMAHGEGGLNVADSILRNVENKAKRYVKKNIDNVQGFVGSLSDRAMNHADGQLLQAQMVANRFAEKAGNNVGIYGRSPGLPSSIIGPDPTNTSVKIIRCSDFPLPHIYPEPSRRAYVFLCSDLKETCFFCLNAPGESIRQSTGFEGLPNDTGDTPVNPIHIIPARIYFTNPFHTIDHYSTWYRAELAWHLATKLGYKGLKIRSLHKIIESVGLYTGQTNGVPVSFGDFITRNGG